MLWSLQFFVLNFRKFIYVPLNPFFKLFLNEVVLRKWWKIEMRSFCSKYFILAVECLEHCVFIFFWTLCSIRWTACGEMFVTSSIVSFSVERAIPVRIIVDEATFPPAVAKCCLNAWFQCSIPSSSTTGRASTRDGFETMFAADWLQTWQSVT